MSMAARMGAEAVLPTLKRRVFGAGLWAIGGFGLSQAIRLGSNLIMTRLLVPEMFGVVAIATMVMMILALLSDLGVSQNIVQSRRGDDPAFLDTAWVVQIARGGLLWLLALSLCAALHLANAANLLPPASVYASPVLPAVIAVSALQTVLIGLQSTRMATALRNLDQKRLMQIELTGQLAGLAVMLVTGLATRSIWALVAGGLVAALTVTVLSHSWLRGHANRFRIERKALGELIGFGKWIFISSAVGVLAINGDRLLLGGFVDAHTMGLYAIATLIVGAIEGGLSKLFIAVSLPALSETARNNPAKLREHYNRLSMPGDLLLLFLAGLLFAAGQMVIDLLYDARYAAAGGMLEVLALSLCAVRYGVAHQIYLAVGQSRYLMVINIARFVSLYALVPALYYTVGLQAAIWGIALHALATLPFVYFFNDRLGLTDVRRELLVLLALPAGYFCGSALLLLRG
jgi:O-antigen/teichoic acid export membrane protein